MYLTTKGGTPSYTFAFDYINKFYIKANLNGVELVYGQDYTVSEKTLTLIKDSDSQTLIIYRKTPTNATVEWNDTSIFRAKDLNLMSVQLLHVGEENRDELQDSGIAEDKEDNKWNAKEKPIKNMADPTDKQDAVTLGYMESVQNGYIQTTTNLVNQTQSLKDTTQSLNMNTKQLHDNVVSMHNHVEQDMANVEANKVNVQDNTDTVKDLSSNFKVDLAGYNETKTQTLQQLESVRVTVDAQNTAVNTNAQMAQRANEYVKEAVVTVTEMADRAKYYAENAKEIAGVDVLTKQEADAKFATKGEYATISYVESTVANILSTALS